MEVNNIKLCNKIMEVTNDFAKQSKWTDIALLKISAAALGMAIGLSVPKRKEESLLWCSTIVYTATSIPLMMKFLSVLENHIIVQETSLD